MSIEQDLLSREEVADAFEALFKWLDYMAEQEVKPGRHPRLPKTLKAFLRMGQKPKKKLYQDIKKRFGLLRFKSWHRLVFDTDKSKGAYTFLYFVKEFTNKVGGKLEWEIGAWKEDRDKYWYADYVEQNGMDHADPDSVHANPDDDSDGTSPQKGDNPPV